ncbi:HNH endonuclease signature motif containing protein [Blastococcus sp. CT_GayMR16]|uniref:HNH endonuclease signature motif containing protein n=1 Tax=Blastococcus sp. CT_GayMR16 TaxID=2559607 RepID=UPI001073EEB7|nr:HNH endonuclease signature motif containing protein [Blastococcus sp. CT_GayMR16]TFV87434.1 HNH endonuclease [Blastococcus sp. CT_GayMR16]
MDSEPDRAPEEGEPIRVLPEDLAPALTETELVADIWAADAREARYVAERAVSIAHFARRRRRQRLDEFGPRGSPGLDSRHRQPVALADYSETLVAELAFIRSCSEIEAESLLVESLVLVHELRGTWSALYEGRIDVRKMRALVDLLGPATPQAIAAIEAQVLPVAGDITVAQLRMRVRRALVQLDSAALEQRRAEAAKRADVCHQPTGDGLSRLMIDLPVWKAAACVDVVRQYADLARTAGDRRPIGVIRAEVAADLMLRPWDRSRPAVTARLDIQVPLSALRPAESGRPAPAAEVAGEIVTAAECREILHQLDMLGVQAAPVGGCVQVAIGNSVTGQLIAVATRNELRRGSGSRRRRRTRRGTDDHRPSSDTSDDGPGLRPPPPTSAYRPTAHQRRFIRARDRSCRMPGCRRAPGRCDIDHGTAHADGGPTDCWNLCCLCRRHHRIKTFARDWHFQLLADGRLIVRTPSGVARITRPPGWCEDVEPDPPWIDEEAPPDVLIC